MLSFIFCTFFRPFYTASAICCMLSIDQFGRKRFHCRIKKCFKYWITALTKLWNELFWTNSVLFHLIFEEEKMSAKASLSLLLFVHLFHLQFFETPIIWWGKCSYLQTKKKKKLPYFKTFYFDILTHEIHHYWNVK